MTQLEIHHIPATSEDTRSLSGSQSQMSESTTTLSSPSQDFFDSDNRANLIASRAAESGAVCSDHDCSDSERKLSPGVGNDSVSLDTADEIIFSESVESVSRIKRRCVGSSGVLGERQGSISKKGMAKVEDVELSRRTDSEVSHGIKSVDVSAGVDSSQDTVAKAEGVTCYLDQGCSFSDSKNQREGEQRSTFDIREELSLLRRKCAGLYGENGNPEMEPMEFETLCQEAGAKNIFQYIFEAMRTERQTNERIEANKKRTVAIIYMLMYGQSQRANWFQVALGRTLQECGITDQGLWALKNLGIAAHPNTIAAARKASASTHTQSVQSFFRDAKNREQLIAIFIDDFHNIHTMHRPDQKEQTQTVHMATLLVKVFPGVPAISNQDKGPPNSAEPADLKKLKKVLKKNMKDLSKSFAHAMPDWATAKYFDQETTRQRLLVHDYQHEEIREMRSMKGCKLVDMLELPLKSYDAFLEALSHMMENGLSEYLDEYCVPFIGDWPAQFYVRQIIYSNAENLPAQRKNIVPLLGPLHISLNARECVVMNFHAVFDELYKFLFGERAKLAKKPRPYRISFLLEVLYGGWSLIRSQVLIVFANSKDIEYMVLLNLLDNYIPTVLSVYSIIFKGNDSEQYFDCLLRCWVMFLVFKRHHYNKAPLFGLSLYQHLQDTLHPFQFVFANALVALDEYPVENFHSVLRKRTREIDTGPQISLKAKEIDANKTELHNFKSAFVPPKRYAYSQKNIKTMKVKAAEFLVLKFELLLKNPGKASKVIQGRGAMNLPNFKLPNLFGETVVTSKVMPLGFSIKDKAPNHAK